MEYVFIFGIGHGLGGHYIRIKARSYGAARIKMFELYGEKWAFQYEATYWDTIHAYKPFAEKQFGETIDAMDIEEVESEQGR